MAQLTLLPGSKLTYLPSSSRKLQDVSSKAHQYLMDNVELDPAVTLGDLFGLFERCPALIRVLRRDFSVELLAEALKGPLEPTPMSSGSGSPVQAESDAGPAADPDLEKMEYLELYAQWYFHSANNTYADTSRLSLHGVGVVLKQDAEDYGVKAGERIHWGISMAPLREMLNLPVRVSRRVEVVEGDIDAFAYGQKVNAFEVENFSLGQVLHSVLWDLSFYGAPEATQKVAQSLHEQVEDIKAGVCETRSFDDLFLKLDAPGFRAMFKSLGGHTTTRVRQAIRLIPDDTNAAQALAAEFEGLVVREAFRSLGGRHFRKQFREARVARPRRKTAT